jgi:hypothetical protein
MHAKLNYNKQWKSAFNNLPFFEYDIKDSFDVIADIVKLKQANLIIGPSESGLFLNLYLFLDFKNLCAHYFPHSEHSIW